MELYQFYKTILQTPLGEMIGISSEKGLCLLEFIGIKGLQKELSKFKLTLEKPNIILKQLNIELNYYFSGNLKTFSTPLEYSGTDFQISVWKELSKIHFGKTISYLKLANKIGNPKSIRAVANANGKNKIAILIPCHRVIGSNGGLVGYKAGLKRKKSLLDLENKISHHPRQMDLFSKFS